MSADSCTAGNSIAIRSRRGEREAEARPRVHNRGIHWCVGLNSSAQTVSVSMCIELSHSEKIMEIGACGAPKLLLPLRPQGGGGPRFRKRSRAAPAPVWENNCAYKEPYLHSHHEYNQSFSA